jgi:CRISPR-associated protein Cas1
MRVLNTLYVSDYQARIGVTKGSILVRKPAGSTRVPIETLEALILLGGQITVEAIDLCVRNEVRIAALRRSGRIRFTVGPPTSGNVYLRVAQVRAADDKEQAAEVARSIVIAKLASYRRSLLRWAADNEGAWRYVLRSEAEAIAGRIDALDGVVDGDRLRGFEGDGTRRYFKGLGIALESGGLVGRFETRSRRPPRDPANSLLSFLYGLGLVEVIGALESIGLDPQIGFLHNLRPGRSSLGLDLLEELRPMQDRLAVRLLRRRQVRLEHFVRTGAGAWYLNDEGRKVVLEAYEAERETVVEHRLLDRSVDRWALPIVQATLLARFLRGDLPSYPAFAMVN